jgi:hypothetical protein
MAVMFFDGRAALFGNKEILKGNREVTAEPSL